MFLGQAKLKRELDIVKVLKLVRDLKVMKAATLEPVEQMLVKYQKSRIIESDESVGAEDLYNY